ncbi:MULTISPECIES: transcription/translation regulatory transformer protein RfaH [unclassified Halomonas]|uniref:transcription/translation regulatory transformer protein RfaH n=1 Tax=unclassified Halomonas TaxID=2609666 RepID=UPI0021E3AE08|nr:MULTISPECIES: transcription/translation regulatory transformer protein RfaH [unclassified Halomonas]UYG01502.1 transcription/translation regulatory transformer protein RfaH [Halomonas sp. GD1P12]WNL40757.1 transcription/translation regulatory transformer protein RfaH [Halomonas sp. PAMB 3264]
MPYPSSVSTRGHWYAIQCKGNESFRAEENLLRQGYTVFHPTLSVRKKRGGRLVHVTEPLFPHYLFIFLDQIQSNWRPIRSTRGVSKLVAFGQQPAVIDEELIHSLKHQCSPQQVGLSFEKGQTVSLESGPFTGRTAIFQQELERAGTGEERAIILLQWLNRTHEVEVPVAHLT